MLKFILGIIVGFVIVSYYPQIIVHTTDLIKNSGVCEQIYKLNLIDLILINEVRTRLDGMV